MELTKAQEMWGKHKTSLEQTTNAHIGSIDNALDTIERRIDQLKVDQHPSATTLAKLQSLVIWYDVVLTLYKEQCRQDEVIKKTMESLLKDFEGMQKVRTSL